MSESQQPAASPEQPPTEPTHPFRAPESFAAPQFPPPQYSPAPPPPVAGGPVPPPVPGAEYYVPQQLTQVAQPRKVLSWGLGQVWLGLGIALGLNLVVSVIAFAVWLALNPDVLTAGDAQGLTEKILNDLTGSPLFLLASLVTLWAGFLAGVFIASYGRGQRSLALDFGWRIIWRTDVILGIALAIALRLADAGFGWLLQTLGVNPETVDNSGPIVNQQGIGLILVGLAAAIGAPIVEELFFRGLTLRALQKRWGPVVAVIGSSLLFGVLHAQPNKSGGIGTSSLWLVLFISGLGAVLAIVAIKTKRLGITVVAHMTFNASALVLAVLMK